MAGGLHDELVKDDPLANHYLLNYTDFLTPDSLFLAHEDKFCVTPVYHVFAMYAAHQGGQSVRLVAS